MKYIISTFFIFITFNYVNAQTEIFNDNGSWFTFTNKIKVSEKFYITNVTQQRRVNFLKNTQAFLIAPSVNYKITKNVSFGAGYMHYTYFPNGVLPSTIKKEETRFFQDLLVNSSLGNIKVNIRFRFEQRVIDLINTNVIPNIIDGNKHANRFRYRLQATTNLMKLKNETFIMGRLSNEIRIRFGTGISEPDFDQNNFAALLGYKLLPNSTIWMGYGRYYFRKNATLYKANNILHINLSYDFDLTKKG